jgi:hypothetical protein
LCLVRLSELHARYPVITVDEADVRVYRRRTRDPPICPPWPRPLHAAAVRG